MTFGISHLKIEGAPDPDWLAMKGFDPATGAWMLPGQPPQEAAMAMAEYLDAKDAALTGKPFIFVHVWDEIGAARRRLSRRAFRRWRARGNAERRSWRVR